MDVDLDRQYANEKDGAYAFCIHGSVHHLMNPELIPNPKNDIQQQPRFAQTYIFDSSNELQNSLNVAGSSELSSEQPNGIEYIQIIFRVESDTDIRRYNAPIAGEIGVLIVGGEDESKI
ncbi:hypothetical protein MAM1_0007d00805 [Mucor ambiguus]|uniref:Uncharacterized protein n=1 Tax=Mucor ambiguus TaxID=91626 RepID=A0A0C9MEF1_9FUNG|nr:hypothetical protein MAM1_0007d00805 [Mucor ambiguus]